MQMFVNLHNTPSEFTIPSPPSLSVMTVDYEDHVTVYPDFDSSISAGVVGLKRPAEYMFEDVINKNADDLNSAIEYATLTKKSDMKIPCVRLLAVDSVPTVDESECAPEEAMAELAADHSVSGMLGETLTRLEAAVAESSVLLQDGLADPTSYAGQAGKLKTTIFEVQLVVAASLPSDGPVVDALATSAAQAERVVAQLESRANAWNEFTTARDAANKQFDELCLRLIELWTANKQRLQQKVVVTREDVTAAYGLLDDLSRHQDTISVMKKFAQELEPLELLFQEIRSLEDSIPQMARNGQDLMNDLWKQDLEVQARSEALWIKYDSLRSAAEEQLHMLCDILDEMNLDYALRKQEKRRATDADLTTAISEAQKILYSLRETRAGLQELGDQLVALGKHCSWGSGYIDCWIDKTIGNAEWLVDELYNEQDCIDHATTEGNDEINANRTFGDHVYLLDPQDPGKWIVLSTDADITKLWPKSDNPVRCEDVGTPDAPDHPLDQHEAWTEYLTLKQDAQFHFQWVQQTLVKLGNEMMVRKRDGIPATEADLELAKGVHEDALAMMESLSKLRQERERLDLPYTRACWEDRCFKYTLKQAAANAEWLVTKLSAETKARAEAVRQDVEARLYHLEVRLAELGLDRVMRQEDGTPVSAADYDAAVHVLQDLHVLMGKRNLGDDHASLVAEIENAIDDAQWLLDRVREEMHKVDPADKDKCPSNHPGFLETASSTADEMEHLKCRIAAWTPFVDAFDSVDSQFQRLQAKLEELGLSMALRRQSPRPEYLFAAAINQDENTTLAVQRATYGLETEIHLLRRLSDALDRRDRPFSSINNFAAKFRLVCDNTAWLIKSLKEERRTTARALFEAARQATEALMYQCQERVSELGFEHSLRKQENCVSTESDLRTAVQALECIDLLRNDNHERYSQLVHTIHHIETSYIPNFDAELQQMKDNAEWLVAELRAEIGGSDRHDKKQEKYIKCSNKKALEKRVLPRDVNFSS
ncbi:hypothetical protein PRIPAC_86787 [Pristionchus pacificus]|uniref:Nuclear anchorage protein 1 spectrin-like repeat domain-containing protein n=1 Tax=Pristionchus pacificus TaxID=54126 RepID=A0A2A6BUX6_PRIPA|nr:hypothetical protein PRIPAC_86787 [Pristionchus pacificus]|eukprot:PDM69626.1 hypothetical protein PRIPAC_44722 [Pristionchus pacificus]